MGRLGLGSDLGQRFRAFASRAERPLRITQDGFRFAALLGETGNRFAGLALPGIESRKLFADPRGFGRDELAALPHARLVVGGAMQLRLHRDDRLFLPMQLRRQRGDRRGRHRNRLLELPGLGRKPLERLTGLAHALAKLLDLALGRENATGFDLGAADHDVIATENIAVERGHRVRHAGGERRRGIERRDDRRLANRGANRRLELAVHANDGRQRHRFVRHRHEAPGLGHRHIGTEAAFSALRRHAGLDHDKTAASGVFLANQRQAGGRVLVPAHDDVLQQVAQTGLDRPLVLRRDIEDVRKRAHLPDPAIGLNQDHARRVAETGAMRVELFERSQAGGDRRQLVFARAHFAGPPFVLDPCARQLGLAGRAGDARGIERFVGEGQGIGRTRTRRGGALVFGPKVRRLGFETAVRLGGALTLCGRRIERGGQRGEGVDHGIDFRARGLNRGLGAFDRLLRSGVFRRRRGGIPRRRVARLFCIDRRRPARLERQSFRLAPLGQRRMLDRELGAARLQHLGLLGVERDLLLAAIDLELAAVRGLPHTGGSRFRGRQLDTQATQVVLDFGEAGGRSHFLLTRAGEPRPRRLDDFAEHAVAAREQDALPAAHLVAQPRITPRLGRLTLERAALLLDLEDDVVDPGEVLLRGLELELGGAPAGLVLGDARRLFDQLAAIGGARRQNQADLALLDDRVGLRTQACIHQQLVDVAEPANLTVDQVFALAGSIEPARHFNFANGLEEVVDLVDVPMSIPMAIAVGVFVVAVAVGATVTSRRGASQFRRQCRHRPGRPVRQQRRREGDATESEPNLRGAGRLSSVGAAEDDVFHLLAAQALRALFAHDPGQGIGDVALAAAIRADDRGHATIERQLRMVGEGLEASDIETFETHVGGLERGRA